MPKAPWHRLELINDYVKEVEEPDTAFRMHAPPPGTDLEKAERHVVVGITYSALQNKQTFIRTLWRISTKFHLRPSNPAELQLDDCRIHVNAEVCKLHYCTLTV